MNVTAKTCKGWQAVKSSILQYAMSDEIPRYIDEYSRSPESVPMEPQPVFSAETELSGGETLPDQPLSGPAGDTSELPPTPEVAARSPKAMVIGLGVAAAVLAAF